jgi:hypothetical protein
MISGKRPIICPQIEMHRQKVVLVALPSQGCWRVVHLGCVASTICYGFLHLAAVLVVWLTTLLIVPVPGE